MSTKTRKRLTRCSLDGFVEYYALHNGNPTFIDDVSINHYYDIRSKPVLRKTARTVISKTKNTIQRDIVRKGAYARWRAEPLASRSATGSRNIRHYGVHTLTSRSRTTRGECRTKIEQQPTVASASPLRCLPTRTVNRS